MVSIANIEVCLQNILFASLHAHIPDLAYILYMAAQGNLSSATLQQRLATMPSIRPLLNELAGQQITIENTVISFDQDVRIEYTTRSAGIPLRRQRGRWTQRAANDPEGDPGQVGFLNDGAVNGSVVSMNEVTMNHTEVTVHSEHGSLLKPAAQPTIIRTPPPRSPAPVQPFYNREQVLRQIEHELHTGQGVWLTGQPGCGHTTLLRQVANHLTASQAFPDGVLYIDGRQSPHDLDDLVQLLYNAFFRSTDGSVVRRHPSVTRTELSNLHALFVLDRAWLNSHQLVSLVDTLGRTGGMLVAADGLAPDTLLDLHLDSLPCEDAFHLFVAEADCDLAQPDVYALTMRICAAFHHLPLPLLLVARLVRVQPAILPQLVASAEALTSEREPLYRAVRLILPFLTDCERAVLAGLVHTGGYDLSLEALVHICEQTSAAVADALTRMADLRLVTGAADRYMIMTSSLRRVLAHMLPRGEEPRRTAAFFTTAVPAQIGNLAWLGCESLNLMASARAALLDGQAHESGQLVRALQPYVVLRGYWNDWEHLIDLAEQAAQVTDDQALQAWALHERGTRAGLLGNLSAAATQLAMAWRLRLDLDDQAGAAVTWQNIEYLDLLPSLSDLEVAQTVRSSLGLRLLLCLIISLAVGGIGLGVFVLLTNS